MPYAKPEHVKAMRKRRYMERREALVERLGGCCADCGADDVPLEFDHLTERRWSNRSVGGLQRIRNYEREAARGEIALRCALCHDVRHGFISPEESARRRALNVGNWDLPVPPAETEMDCASVGADETEPF